MSIEAISPVEVFNISQTRKHKYLLCTYKYPDKVLQCDGDLTATCDYGHFSRYNTSSELFPSIFSANSPFFFCSAVISSP